MILHTALHMFYFLRYYVCSGSMKTTWASEIDVQDTTKKTTFYKYMTFSTFSTCYSQDSCFNLFAESQYPGYITVQKDPCDCFHFCTAEILATKANKTKKICLDKSENCLQNSSYCIKDSEINLCLK
jgi:hypothetical protein